MHSGLKISTPGRPWHYKAAAFTFAVGMAGTTLPTPLYGLYQEHIGFSSLMVTIIFATYAAGVIAVLTLASNFSDLLGRRPVLLAALGFSVASAVCFVFEDGLPLLFIGRVVSGLSAGLFTGTATVAVMELAPEESRGRAGFAATAANMGGLGCGPLLAGILAAYAPWPLRLPYLVHLGLLMVAIALTLPLPETVPRREPRPALRPRLPHVPQEVRGVFVPAALAAFAGFSMFGLFTSVAPSFMAKTLGVHDLAVSGAVVFAAFAASTVGQLAMNRVGVGRALPAGCFVLVAGMVLIGCSLLFTSLALLVAGAVVSGLGQGLSFRAGMAAVTGRTPKDRRGETTSAFFVVAYLGISLPVIGVGALSLPLGLRDAGLVFSVCVVALAAVVGGWLLHHSAVEPTTTE
ncbi:MFS transporter [Streptomyces sp. NBC_00859]|uniref:MFS transporter n=1 Tax=Streptomyces sp. NBC_00859 TaxID=2903682 RepID=UPI00386E731C|nr:MFS transporter [Streptomyces sp. NBC_00859]